MTPASGSEIPKTDPFQNAPKVNKRTSEVSAKKGKEGVIPTPTALGRTWSSSTGEEQPKSERTRTSYLAKSRIPRKSGKTRTSESTIWKKFWIKLTGKKQSKIVTIGKHREKKVSKTSNHINNSEVLKKFKPESGYEHYSTPDPRQDPKIHSDFNPDKPAPTQPPRKLKKHHHEFSPSQEKKPVSKEIVHTSSGEHTVEIRNGKYFIDGYSEMSTPEKLVNEIKEELEITKQDFKRTVTIARREHTVEKRRGKYYINNESVMNTNTRLVKELVKMGIIEKNFS